MDRCCFLCGRTQNLHKHHVYGGSFRKTSEKYGAVVDLCVDCHTGRKGVHQDPDLLKLLKRQWQEKFELTHSREEFIKTFGRNFL